MLPEIGSIFCVLNGKPLCFHQTSLYKSPGEPKSILSSYHNLANAHFQTSDWLFSLFFLSLWIILFFIKQVLSEAHHICNNKIVHALVHTCNNTLIYFKRSRNHRLGKEVSSFQEN